MEQQNNTNTVSVVIPVYNEEKYIEKCISSVLEQDYDKSLLEILLVDGQSEDKTVEIIKEYEKKYPFITLLDNPGKLPQYAMNIGITAAKGEYIVRMDAHAEYADDYISKCIETIKKTNAANVGGPTIAVGKTNKQKAVAAAFHSKFALGGGKHHDAEYEGSADSVWGGTFKRQTLMDMDLFDERMNYTEDDDINQRIRNNGGIIYITPKIKCYYYPRENYSSLFKQYFRYGKWRVAFIKKHKKPARISHLVPVCFVLFLIFGLFSFINCLSAAAYLSVLTFYLLLNIFFSFTNKNISGIIGKLRLVYIHFLLHISYGFGFICGILRFFNAKF